MEDALRMIKRALYWKLLERFGVQSVQFILQIILARLLDPEHYGVLSLMAIFTTLANVFIQTGFNTALVQNKDVTDEDYSSVFWASEIVALALYIILFLLAPVIAMFYKMPDMVSPFRIMSLLLFPGALNSVQIAKVSRELNFRKLFLCNVIAIIGSGLVGIYLAFKGAGVWALVIQNLLNVTIATTIMLFAIEWKPRRILSIERIRVLFSYGWKLLVSNLLENIYVDLRNLVIGRKYNSVTLGFSNRGKQFPQFIMNATNDAVKSVMLSAMSKSQDNKNEIKNMARMSIMLSSYIIFPVMFGLAGVSNALVTILLTDKWIECVPYMQMYCIALAFAPMSSCTLQAINAIGRSDIYLRLEILKRLIGTGTIVIAVIFFESPLAITITSPIMAVLDCFINAYPNKNLINYKFKEQIRDIGPSLTISVIMFVVVYYIGSIFNNAYYQILAQIVVGVVLYIGASAVFRLRPFVLLLNSIQKMETN